MSGLDPHYRHDRSGLQAVVSPPVDDVCAVAWHPRREELVVAGRAGTLALFDPVMGTRTLADDLPEAGAVAVDGTGERVAILGRGGPLELRTLPGADRIARVEVGLVSSLWVAWWRNGVVVTGKGLDGARILVLDEQGRRRAAGALPDGVVAGVDADGRIVLGRVTSGGPEIHPLGKGRFDRRAPTSHRLRFTGQGRLLGVAEGGVTVWEPDGSSLTVRSFGITSAALSRDEQTVAIGTRDGGVGLAGLQAGSVDRAHPDKTGGHELAVRSVGFSRRGRWLASVGDRLWLWSW
ncbi:MAG: hypothetical protein H6742_01620 [Alphaproteobacteria bacterium]|nr:hypothetical protein [Alphaproteobacteria bacterium]